MTREYIDVADCAKLIRRALRDEFSGQRFSVRSDRYSGGASIRVKWTGGPALAAVEGVAKRYEGASFDGMIDLKEYRTHWLRPDGRVLVEHDPGTVGSMGILEGEDNRDLQPVIPEDARRVQFGADFVFCEREDSPEELAERRRLYLLSDHDLGFELGDFAEGERRARRLWGDHRPAWTP